MAIEMNIEASGFWRTPIYMSYIPSVLKEFEDSFGNAQILELQLKEDVNSPVNSNRIDISDDGSSVTVLVLGRLYLNGDSLTQPPSPSEAIEDIRFWLSKAHSAYRQKFE